MWSFSQLFIQTNVFKKYETFGYKLGFDVVESGPLVRSSYHADKQAKAYGLHS